MKSGSLWKAAAVSFAGILSCAHPARALLLTSPDQICAPEDEHCFVTTPTEVSDALPLDFGSRVVHIAGDGRFIGSLDLRCGGFDTEAKRTWIEVPADSSNQVRILATKGCSGDFHHRCLTNADCAGSELGTCGVGDGGVRLRGDANQTIRRISLVGAGDVELDGAIVVRGDPGFESGGGVSIDSSGSVRVRAFVDASAREDESAELYHYAGTVEISAADDIVLVRRIRAKGGDGEVSLHAGGDIDIRGSIEAQAWGFAGNGGTIDLRAGGSVALTDPPGPRRTVLRTRGGTTFIPPADIGGGDAGDGRISADENIVIGEGVVINSNSGRDNQRDVDDEPEGGEWSFFAGNDIVWDGVLRAGASGPNGAARSITLEAGGSIATSPTAVIDARAQYGAQVYIDTDLGPIDLGGTLRFGGGYGLAGRGGGGSLFVSGSHVTVSGRIENGGGFYAGDIEFRACRLHLTSTGAIDNSLMEQFDSAGDLEFWIYESMVADAGSAILAKERAETRIFYRNEAQPPLLLGVISPDPKLSLNESLSGCPD